MRTATTTALALVAALAVAGLAACAAGGKAPPASAPTSAEPGPPPLSGRPDELRAEIARLDGEIAAQLGQAGVSTPDASAIEAAAGVPLADLRATCARPTDATCADVCRLGDSICDNAATICELADELPGDRWAADKCSTAKASCTRANERCCSC